MNLKRPDDFVSHIRSFRFLMRHEKHGFCITRGGGLPDGAQSIIHNPKTGIRIQPLKRFIQQKQIIRRKQSPKQRHTPALPAGKLSHWLRSTGKQIRFFQSP